MSAVLLDALLSHCPDIEPVLDALCWPGSSVPETERVESLAALIKELIHKPLPEPVRSRLALRLQAVVWDQCVPLLKSLSSESISSHGRQQVLHAVCGLLGVCVGQCSVDSLEKLVTVALPAFSPPDSDVDQPHLDLDVATELLGVLLSSQKISESPPLALRALSCTLSSVKEVSEAQASKIIVRIWFASLKSSTEERRADVLQHIWEDLLGWHERQHTAAVTARALLCLTALSDHLFSTWERNTPIQGQEWRPKPDPRESRAFFGVVQAGLQHRDNVSRKRALYLLKRCVSLAEVVDAAVCVRDPGGFG
ncbi:hypothetical protein NFI96_000642 [Prochilodus magdalenae]|nr:hypothetical protein NFI96_000642 [Prochilodus magdalenae]